MSAQVSMKNPNSIYDDVDISLIFKYFDLKDAGKEDEADELIKHNLPIPAYLSESAIAIFGRDIYVDAGFKIIERDFQS